ncbi:uncharacterized protein LOC110226779 [Arabidopsis lyrata subsp. lyrata]|uniref:uncharacterized protein LOC110226779 n=1 Tax=Arabidopsis lyrata subsp. lyrata TaxID=81972 RepID=UPI000A29DC30|nr:uncharacterized protein LOC110226779 [Arabidopsis lyrata subsp. lyrata]|eukprot:XP_020875103.1 uncharacterized protein LOC110226779 [Arabidopsis lyrata subsp. lyrata]
MEVRGPVIWMFLMCCIFGNIIVSHHNDFVEAKSFSKSEDLEIEKRLKTINKPAVKIIKTIDGERYGCVDFFKQPAFDHPSMKNHTYHYKMRPIWKGMRERKRNNTAFGYLWENGVGCPIGTVPIKRVTKDDLLRLDSFVDNYKPRGSWNTTTYDPNSPFHPNHHHFAVARTKNIGKRFNGATTALCITAPKVKPTQFSNSRLHMQMGRDFVQAGLTVNPVLYKDRQPRTFVFTSSGGRSCYNNNCDSGIIVIRHDFPLGMALPPSIRGAKTSNYGKFSIVKDTKYGWWYQYGVKPVEIGLWPERRFRQSYGDFVEWGGEVYTASLPSPQMGYGYFPIQDISYDAYIEQIAIFDNNYNIDRNLDYLEVFSDNNRGYRVIDTRDPSGGGHVIFYGGPGNILKY